jgi:hypothetical protein
LSDLEEKPPCDACPTRATTTTASTCTLMYSVTHQTPLKLADNVNTSKARRCWSSLLTDGSSCLRKRRRRRRR